jgi:iron complex transport system permease protein
MRNVQPYLWLAALLALALVLSVGLGAVPVPPLELARIALARLGLGPAASVTAETIVLDIRLPRTALVALTGAALGGSGAAYQGLFRNPLADPYLIGVASGAGLGAVAAMAWRWPAGLLSLIAVPAAAFVGALLTVLLVYRLARSGPAAPTATLILAGVAVGAFATALTTFIMLRSEGELRRAIGWMLGGFALGGWGPVLAALPYVAAGLAVLIALGRPLNVLQFGDEQARQLGLDVERVRLVLIAAASLATAAAVAFSGIIGFVGLAVPHLVRLLWGSDYRRLVPLATLGGAAVLLLADVVARSALAPQELPVGIVTALAGAPFFLYLLRASRQRIAW